MGQLFMQTQDRADKGPDIVRLLRHLAGKLLVIWDGSPIHRAQPIKDVLAQGAAARLRIERLPGYALDLNPDEGIWQPLKHVELRNLCATTCPSCATPCAPRPSD